MPEEFDRFVQDQLESFRRTCDADLEKMETLEQVSYLSCRDTLRIAEGPMLMGLGWQEFKEQLQSQVSNYLKCLVADL